MQYRNDFEINRWKKWFFYCCFCFGLWVQVKVIYHLVLVIENLN